MTFFFSKDLTTFKEINLFFLRPFGEKLANKECIKQWNNVSKINHLKNMKLLNLPSNINIFYIKYTPLITCTFWQKISSSPRNVVEDLKNKFHQKLR